MKNAAKFPLESITPFTLLDYPDQTACILWFAGCNMKCSYCYNPEIVFSKGKISYDEALKFLKTRQGLLDGVVLSGGECTIQKGFVDFVKEIKQLGFNVKLDTNGTAPWVLKELLELNFIDYLALDFKSQKANFFEITKSKLYHRFEESLDILIQSKAVFEVRTTFHGNLLSIDNVKSMGSYLLQLGYQGKYFIQHFRNDTATIGDLANNYVLPSVSDFEIPGLTVEVRIN